MIGRVGVAGVAALLLLGACSVGAGDEAAVPPRDAALDGTAEPDGPADDVEARDDPDRDLDGELESRPEDPDESAEPGVTVCDAATRTGIDETIGGQLAAFAADDYQGALGFASRAFRAGIDAPAFRAMIESEFVVAADASTHALGACRQVGSRAQAVVEITAADSTRTRMVYSLVEEEGSWLISGAVIAGSPGGTLA